MKKQILFFSLLFLLIWGCKKEGSSGVDPDPEIPCSLSADAVVTNKGTYYEIVLDFRNGLTHRQIGEYYSCAVKSAIPNYELLLDSFLKEKLYNSSTFNYFLSRANQIKAQIPSAYLDEIKGFASKLSGGTTNSLGDNKLSEDEILVLNLIPDIARTAQCSAVSVFGSRSATSKTMTARVLDWSSGSQHQLNQIQAMITIKNSSQKYLYSIGYIGFIGILSGFNNDKVFAAILDSSTGASYPSSLTGFHSYPLDLRYSLENRTTLNDVANDMKTQSYAFNHLIYLSDPTVSKVLENNLSGTRALRTDSSSLNAGVSWGFSNALAAVNSFILNGNTNNHTGAAYNANRWDSIKTNLTAKGSSVSLNALKEIISYHSGALPGSQDNGDVYNSSTQQIIVFQPDTLSLEVFFSPAGNLPAQPVFETVTVSLP